MKSTNELHELARTLGGIPVLGCVPNTPSARAGVRYGDILLRVNGMPTPDLDAYIQAKGLNPELLEVTLFRDGVEIELSFEVFEERRTDVRAALAHVVDSRTFSLPDAEPRARNMA